jgi:hypothetical protein
MDRKAFLVPVAVAIAALVTDVGSASHWFSDRVKTAFQEARTNPSTQDPADKTSLAELGRDEQTLLLRRPADPSVIAQHSSHASHGSHGSHGSHSSHSSGT